MDPMMQQGMDPMMAMMMGGGIPPMPGGMGAPGAAPPMGDPMGQMGGLGGTTPLTLPQNPMPDPVNESMLLQQLLGMSQGGIPTSGQQPVGGMY